MLFQQISQNGYLLFWLISLHAQVMPTSCKRSREASLWRRLDPAQASRVMVGCYGQGAGAEVLLRAFLEERDLNPAAVRFWLRVYAILTRGSEGGASPPV
jgi:hypothetical protein